MKKRPLKALALPVAVATILVTSACTPTHNVRGNLLEDHQIAQVKVGEDDVSDVYKKLGSPTARAPFDEGKWYYMGQETEKRGILDPEVVNERIVVVQFDDNGTVTTLEDVDNERLSLPLVEQETPTAGNEMTMFQQFLGNLGKFNREAATQQ